VKSFVSLPKIFGRKAASPGSLNADARVLEETIRKVITLPKYQPGYPKANGEKSTWCLVAAYDILKGLGYEVSLIVDKLGIYYTTPDEMVDLAVLHTPPIKEVSEKYAQWLANMGDCILVAAKGAWAVYKGKRMKIGHVAVVAPSLTPWDAKKGVWQGQAGGVNGFMYRIKGFGPVGKWTEMPRFFVLPKKG
jgi:hypothetical protein